VTADRRRASVGSKKDSNSRLFEATRVNGLAESKALVLTDSPRCV